MAGKNLIQRIGDATERVILSRVKNNNLFNEYYNRKEKGGKANYKRQAVLYDAKEIKDWKAAILAATNPDNPRRNLLMRFNQSLLLDNHLASVIDTRILRVQRSSFKIVNEKGVENEALKELLERPWHDDLIRLALFSRFQGPTLIEMFDTNDAGEIVRVREIPQSNFIPQKGIILNEEYDDNGTSYIEGLYRDYYLQVGDDWDLGMLNQLAMIVLAKKLGLGSWVSYIDKFGVPPVFAITERMDTGRRDELFEMLENFRSNHFAVLQGKETITIPNNYNSDAYQSFKSLINDVCNREISKRVLGGSSTTDEKAFVGAAEVQERLTQDRYESDKLFYQYLFNTEIRQRLVKISSLYADLTTHKLIWDNQETLDIKGYIEAVEKLSSAFDFDITEVRNRTGLPIIGAKTLTPPTEPPAGTVQKKKPDATVKLIGPYAHQNSYFVFAATWDAAIERLANQIYSGEVKPEDLDKDLVLKNYAAFSSEAKRNWGEGYYDSELTRSFRENMLKFSGAKSLALMNEIAGIDAKSKEQFVQTAKNIVQKHNGTWTDTELRYCGATVAAARDYATYLDDIDIYPNLKCRTMQDDEVRDSHAMNEGIVKPVKDWTSLPPFDHGCRCWMEQTTEEPTTDRNLQGIRFHNNPHRSGKVFTDEQPYFKAIPDAKKGVIRDNTEAMKAYMPYNKTIKAGENTVFVNDFAHLDDVEASIIAAEKIAKALETDVYVRPHIENSGFFHVKNPEIGIGKPNNFADLKTFDNKKSTSTRKFVKNGIKSAGKQQCNSVILDFTNDSESDFLSQAADKLHGELAGKHKPTIKKVILIKGDQVLQVSRQDINRKNYIDFFKMD